MICARGYEAFISGVGLSKDPEADAPPVKTQYSIRGEKEKAEIVEKMYFDRLLDFVYVEFMKGLQRGAECSMMGNGRGIRKYQSRCHFCG